MEDQARYNKRARATQLLPGERVLIRNLQRRARGKLEPRWVPSLFVVLSQSPPDPTANIAPESTSAGTSMPARWSVVEVPLSMPFPDAELTTPGPSMEVASEPLSAPQEDEVS
ncbi:hypothetical protein SRHO_G00331820 [Serrasalmus rhombeus]